MPNKIKFKKKKKIEFFLPVKNKLDATNRVVISIRKPRRRDVLTSNLIFPDLPCLVEEVWVNIYHNIYAAMFVSKFLCSFFSPFPLLALQSSKGRKHNPPNPGQENQVLPYVLGASLVLDFTF